MHQCNEVCMIIETKSTEKPAANSEPVSNGQVDSDGGGREGEVEEEEEEEDDGASSPVDRLSQPASLPSSFHPITPVSGSAIVSEPFLSLPSLPGQFTCVEHYYYIVFPGIQ